MWTVWVFRGNRMTLQWKLLWSAKIKVKSFKTHLTDPEVLPSTLDRMRRNKEEAVKSTYNGVHLCSFWRIFFFYILWVIEVSGCTQWTLRRHVICIVTWNGSNERRLHIMCNYTSWVLILFSSSVKSTVWVILHVNALIWKGNKLVYQCSSGPKPGG